LTAAPVGRADRDSPGKVGRETSMAKSTTKIDSISLAGGSGEQYAFRVYVWATSFKTTGGVYVVASRSIEPNGSKSYAPVFVGTADDLSGVFADHPRDECFQMYYANVVAVLPENDAARREEIAADLIAGLEPPCNATDE
jgi:hypothetical protein